MSARNDLFALAVGALALAVTKCAPPADPATAPVVPGINRKVFDSGFGGVWRDVDHEARVVCWVYASGYKGGIFCLPCADVAAGVCDEAAP